MMHGMRKQNSPINELLFFVKKSLSFSRLCFLALVLLLSIGCAAPQQVKRRYFWPPLPDTPRIEFIAAYHSNQDFPMTPWQSFIESMIGAEVRDLEKPWGIVSDGNGKVYVVDTYNAHVVIFDLVNYTVNSLGKGEFAGLLQAPIGVALDGADNIYVSDTKANKVFSFTKDEKPLATIGDDETLDWPTGVVVNDNLRRIYVTNSHKHNIAVFDLSGKYLFSIGKRGERDREFNYPSDIDMDSQGNLVVADAMNARVQVLDPDGKFIRKFGQRGDGLTDFQMMKGIAVDRATDNVYVADARANRFLIFSKEGEPLLTVGGSASALVEGKLNPGGFLLPQDISIDKNGTIYVVDSLNRRFQVFQIVNDEWLKKNPIK